MTETASSTIRCPSCHRPLECNIDQDASGPYKECANADCGLRIELQQVSYGAGGPAEFRISPSLKVPVFLFKGWSDKDGGTMVLGKSYSTRGRIAEIGCNIVESSKTLVPFSDLDEEGRLRS